MTGAELRARREALGLTQTMMHNEMMNVLGKPHAKHPRQLLSRWETDKVPPPAWVKLVVQAIEESI